MCPIERETPAVPPHLAKPPLALDPALNSPPAAHPVQEDHQDKASECCNCGGASGNCKKETKETKLGLDW